jgi:radical SAM superfamily enzyme YgiQ (UPF0313 family)
MKFLLVRPPRVKQAVTVGEVMFCEPIGLEMVAGVLAAEGHDVRILDLMVEPARLLEECRSYAPDVVGLTSLCIDVEAVRTIARQVKAFSPRIVTLAGGTQAYLNPSAFFIEEIDHVFRFTTRENLSALCRALTADAPLSRIDGVHSRVHAFATTDVAGRNEMLLPDRATTARYRAHYSYLGYQPCAIMQTSMGCSKHCDFCLRWRIEGPTECPKALECVVDEIVAIPEAHIMIFDNDFLHDPERLERLCDRLEARGITKTFICYASVKSLLAHPESIRRMARHGLRAVLVGYESFNPDELAAYRKASTVEDNLAASRLLKELGIDCWASFILHPDWTVADFRRLRRFIARLRPEITTCSPLTPFANLPLHARYEDRLLYAVEEFEAWSFGNVVIQPSQMSLRRYYLEVLKTLLYINFRTNSAAYMQRRFGTLTLWRITRGSYRVLGRYLRLLREAPRRRPLSAR